jgi:hypothetical protein
VTELEKMTLNVRGILLHYLQTEEDPIIKKAVLKTSNQFENYIKALKESNDK